MIEVDSVTPKGSTGQGQVQVQISVTVHAMVKDTLGDPAQVEASIFAHLSGSDSRVHSLLLGAPETFLSLGNNNSPGDGGGNSGFIDPNAETTTTSPGGTSAAAIVIPILLLGAIAGVAVLHRKHMLPTNPENKARLYESVRHYKDYGLSKMAFGSFAPSSSDGAVVAGAPRAAARSGRRQQSNDSNRGSSSGELAEEGMYTLSAKDMDLEKDLRSAAKRDLRRQVRHGGNGYASSDTRKTSGSPFSKSFSRSSLSRKPTDGGGGAMRVQMAVASLLPTQHSAAQTGFSGAPPSRVRGTSSNKLYRKGSMP